MRVSKLVFALATLIGAFVAQAETPEERLRNQLKQTTIELREAQDELASLRSQQASLKQRAEAAAAIKAKPVGPSVSPQAQRTIKEQAAQLAALNEQLTATQKSLAEWQKAYQEAADVARSRDAELNLRKAEQLQATGFAESCAAKNKALVQIGNELLDRYRNKGTFSTLLDAEPFTQIHRIKLEEQVQDYHAQIKDNVLEPAVAGPEVPPPPR